MSVFVLLLFTLGADLWVYVGDDYRSRQVVEAVQEPVLAIWQRSPHNETISRYLDELEEARCGLSVEVLYRDDIDFPALAFSRYETPRPILPEALYHPVLICEHLRYCAALADRDMAVAGTGGGYHDPDRVDCRWLIWHSVSRNSTTGVIGTREMLEVMSPVIAPAPPLTVHMPWRLKTSYHSSDDALLENEDRTGVDVQAVLRALDMGTGIVVGQ